MSEPTLLTDVAMLIGEAEEELAIARKETTKSVCAFLYLTNGFLYLTTAKELLAEAEAETKEAD